MNEKSAVNGHLSSVQQLDNLYESFAEDVFDGYIPVDEETRKRATRIAYAAMSSPKSRPFTSGETHHTASSGFAQTFGLHPACALLTVVVNTMLFSGEMMFGEVGWLTSIPVGVVLGIIVFLAQRKWYGDDKQDAFIKSLIVAFLTAIPTSLPGYLTIPSGILGFFRRKK